MHGRVLLGTWRVQGCDQLSAGAQVILMDHVDWQDLAQARELAAVLAKHVAPGGRVIWRSAALCPPYARVIREAGFEVKCLQRADEVPRPLPSTHVQAVFMSRPAWLTRGLGLHFYPMCCL